MRRRIGLCVVVLLAVVSCDAPTVPARTEAYAFTTCNADPCSPAGSAAGLVIHWPLGKQIRYFVDGGAQQAALSAAAEVGARVWNSAALYGEYSFVKTDQLGDADVLIRWSNEPVELDLSACEPSVGRAVTTFCLSADRKSLVPFPLPTGQASNVKMVVTILASELTNGARLATHEMGHVLGLVQHSPNAVDVMHPNSDTIILSRADRATVTVLYHTAADVLP